MCVYFISHIVGRMSKYSFYGNFIGSNFINESGKRMACIMWVVVFNIPFPPL